MKQIYVQSGGNQQGPFSESQIQMMWASGSITMDALYWYEGMSEWAPITQLTEASETTTAPPEQKVAEEEPSSIEQYAAEFQATKQKPTQKNKENKQSSQKLSKKQRKQKQQQAAAGTVIEEGKQGTEAEKSDGWFGELIVLGGFLGICYVLVMFVACPVVHWTIGPDTPEGIYKMDVGTVIDEYESNGDWSRLILLFGTMTKYEGEWDRGGFWGTTISVETDDGKITMTLKYDEDKDTLEQLTRDGKPHKPIAGSSIWKNID